jgi:hypothetical protein
MRNHGFGFIYGMFVLALGCLFFGCAYPLQEPQTTGDTGIVRVLIGNGGRTLMPSLPAVGSYRFSFESLETLPRNPVVRDSANTSLALELSTGSWNLTVTALAAGGSEIARGSARALVLEGVTSSVTVQLGNEPGDATGSLQYSVEFPAAVTRASLWLVSMGGGEDSAPVDLLAGSAQSGGVITKTGVLNVAAGNYLLNIDLYDGSGNAGKTEVVHLYSNTATSSAYAFTAGDFSLTTAYQTGSGQGLSAVLNAIGGQAGRISPFF